MSHKEPRIVEHQRSVQDIREYAVLDFLDLLEGLGVKAVDKVTYRSIELLVKRSMGYQYK